MRKTFRAENNRDYWTNRWDKIDADEVMQNSNTYPLKYAIEALKFNNNNQKILEAGCGAGRILNYLHQKNLDVVGIEFIQNAVDKIKKKFPNTKVKVMDILNTDFKNNEFDLILAFGLYHNFEFDNLEKSLIETKRILKTNGILCFSFRADNVQNLILDKIKQNKNLNIKNNKFHKLNLNKTEILGLLKNHEFEVLKHYYVTNMPLLFHFKFFRSSNQKQFDEHVGRKEGYQLNFFGRILNRFLMFFFKKQYCNIHVFFCKNT